MTAAGLPAPVVEMMLSIYAAYRVGWGSRPSEDLARLMGRPAIPSLEAVRAAVLQAAPAPA